MNEGWVLYTFLLNDKEGDGLNACMIYEQLQAGKSKNPNCVMDG